MRIWLRTRRVGRLSALIIAGSAIVALTGAREFGAPAVIGGGTGRLPVMAFVAVFLGAGFAHMFDGRDTVAEASASRPIRTLDTSLFAVTVLAASLACAAAQSWAGGSWQRGFTSAMIVSSVAVAASCFAGGVAGTVAGLLIFLVSVTYSPNLRGATWVRLLQPEAELTVAWSVAIGVLLLALGCALWARRAVNHQ
jgi:hypothetical protein